MREPDIGNRYSRHRDSRKVPGCRQHREHAWDKGTTSIRETLEAGRSVGVLE